MISQSPNSRPLEIKADNKKTFNTSLVLLIVGLIFIWLTYNKGEISRNQQYAQRMGLLLLFIGGYGVLFTEEILTFIDPKNKIITYKVKTILGDQHKIIPFRDVAQVKVARIGRRNSSYAENYHLQLFLKSGIKLATWHRASCGCFERVFG